VNCKEVEDWIDAYADAELDLTRSVELERHVQDCGSCATALQGRQRLRAAVRSGAMRYPAPPALRAGLHSALRRENPSVLTMLSHSRRWLGLAACLAIAVALTWTVARTGSGISAEDALVQEVVSGHVRSLMADHLTDVPSSDRHTVKPWFNGKLDYAPPVVDLEAQGYPLTGGRLDYLQGRPVAALVYRARQHPINLFVWPSEGGTDGDVRQLERDGYHLASWTHAGMAYQAVSDVNAEELLDFARLLQGR